MAICLKFDELRWNLETSYDEPACALQCFAVTLRLIDFKKALKAGVADVIHQAQAVVRLGLTLLCPWHLTNLPGYASGHLSWVRRGGRSWDHFDSACCIFSHPSMSGSQVQNVAWASPVSGAPAKQVNTTAGGKYLVEDLICHASHFPLPNIYIYNIIQYYSVPSSTLTSLHSRYLDGPPCQNDITALQHRSFSATRNSRKRRVDVPGVVATSAKIQEYNVQLWTLSTVDPRRWDWLRRRWGGFSTGGSSTSTWRPTNMCWRH